MTTGPVEKGELSRSLDRFTLADQVDQLVEAREADPDVGFLTRLMTLCSLPRTNPGNRHLYKRANGPYRLYMQAGPETRLPYGNLPRLLLAWMCTEAVRTQSRELVLGRSLSDFMEKLGMHPIGEGRTRLRNQMDRLFNAHVSLIYEDNHGKATVNSPIADRTELWWNPKRPDAPTLWDSKIELGEKFFNEIISHPIPLDMNTLKALKRSPLGLDLYLWLTYRVFTLKARFIVLPWELLYRQLGADPARANEKDVVNNFRTKCLRELKKIQLAWPDLQYTTRWGRLLLMPSKPKVPPARDK